jgi:BMFP domain-containing protein YqiC
VIEISISGHAKDNAPYRAILREGLMSKKSENFSLDDLARQLADSVPESLRSLGDDVQNHFKALLQSGLERMDLVTREEFDVQVAVLARTREKLETLEARLRHLEAMLEANKN